VVKAEGGRRRWCFREEHRHQHPGHDRQHGLLSAGRYLTLTVGLEDRPGTLAALLKLLADTGANVLEVNHIRQGIHLPVRGVAVRLLLETRDQGHIEEIVAGLVGAGYVETEAEAAGRSFRPSTWES
jgi:hypothetical protein